MSTDLIVDLIKILGPGVLSYLCWLTRNVFKATNDLDVAFAKIRALEAWSRERSAKDRDGPAVG